MELSSILLTVRATELSDRIDKSLVELGGPPESGLGIGGQDQASIHR